MIIGYARVSKTDQNLELQIDELKKAGCVKIFTDVATSAKKKKLEFTKTLEHLRKGDVLVVWKLDRFGNSLKHLIQVISELNERGIGFKVLKENIDTTTSGGKLIFHIFGALAEFDRGIIRKKAKAGLKDTRPWDSLGGRPKKMDKEKIKMAQSLYDSRTMTIDKICKQLGISKATFYKYIKD